MKKRTSKPLHIILWTFGYLAVMDIAVNIVFRYPVNPRADAPSKLTHFFEYGRSVEGKLTRLTRTAVEESAPIIQWGWIQDPQVRYFSDLRDSSIAPTITVYGMSHSVLLAEDLAKVDDSFVVRSCGAPGAVPSWAYATYLSDKEHIHSDAVILAVMTRGVSLICTTSGMTNNFDTIIPYTYPRYRLDEGVLTESIPPFISLSGYLDSYYEPDKWRSFKDWMRANDSYFDPLLFDMTFLERSSIVRMLRRAYAYSSRRKKDARIFSPGHGFDQSSEEVILLKSILISFANDAKQSGSLPIIYIVNNVLMGDDLYRLLEPTLSANDILFLSSHEICPPDNPTLFEANSHFIPEKNILLAKEMMDIIRNNLKSKIH